LLQLCFFLSTNLISFSQNDLIASIDVYNISIENKNITNLINNTKSDKVQENQYNLEHKSDGVESISNIGNISLDKKIIDGYHAPSYFFNLSSWILSVPTDNNEDLRADIINEVDLSSGYVSNYFYAIDEGSMILTCPIGGLKTSNDVAYTKVELKEILRQGNTTVKTERPSKNNWVF